MVEERSIKEQVHNHDGGKTETICHENNLQLEDQDHQEEKGIKTKANGRKTTKDHGPDVCQGEEAVRWDPEERRKGTLLSIYIYIYIYRHPLFLNPEPP